MHCDTPSRPPSPHRSRHRYDADHSAPQRDRRTRLRAREERDLAELVAARAVVCVRGADTPEHSTAVQILDCDLDGLHLALVGRGTRVVVPVAVDLDPAGLTPRVTVEGVTP